MSLRRTLEWRPQQQPVTDQLCLIVWSLGGEKRHLEQPVGPVKVACCHNPCPHQRHNTCIKVTKELAWAIILLFKMYSSDHTGVNEVISWDFSFMQKSWYGHQPDCFSRKPSSWAWNPFLPSPSVLPEAIYSTHQFLHFRWRSVPHNTSIHVFTKTPCLWSHNSQEYMRISPLSLVGTARAGRVILVISQPIVSWKQGLRELGTV